MIIIWLLTGIAAVTLAFFIPPNSPELWPSLNMAIIPVVIYILALALFTLRSPITLKARIISWVSIALVGAATYSSWTGMDSQSHWQHNELQKIRTVIDRGIILSFAPRYELNALKDYHKQGLKKKESLGHIFQRQNNGATIGTNIYKSELPDDSTSIVLKSLSDNEVVLLGLHAFSKGRNPDFKNYSGKVGKVQERFTLTEKGIVYESEN
jgi:hypothetical protein